MNLQYILPISLNFQYGLFEGLIRGKNGKPAVICTFTHSKPDPVASEQLDSDFEEPSFELQQWPKDWQFLLWSEFVKSASFGRPIVQKDTKISKKSKKRPTFGPPL